MSAQHPVTTPHDLQQIFGYAAADLSALQQGRVAEALHERLNREYRLEWLTIGAALIFVAILCTPVLLSNSLLGTVVALAISTAFLLPWCRYLWRLHSDLAAGRVEQASGRFRLRGPLARRSYFNSHYFEDPQRHRYLLKSHEFQLIRQAEALGPVQPHTGSDYTIYYLPRSRRIVAVLPAHLSRLHSSQKSDTALPYNGV